MGDAELVEEDGAPMSAGERLRQAREASGLTLEEIATTTRIPTRHLESLENSDFEQPAGADLHDRLRQEFRRRRRARPRRDRRPASL